MLKEFFAVTGTSVYHVRDDAKQGASAVKVALRGGSDIPVKTDIARGGMIAICHNLQAFVPERHGKSHVQRYLKGPPKKDLTGSWDFHTSGIVALFFDKDERKLKRDVYPVLGNVRADLVTRPDVVRFLDAITDRGAPVHANRTLSLIRKLYNWAIAEGYLEENPARGIPMRAKEQARKRTLSEEEIRTFWHALDGPGFEGVTADALRLQLLLGARIREVTGMVRGELALEQAIPLWTLPAARAKGGRDVLRPLPPVAFEIIQRRLKAAGDSAFVFASPFGGSQSIIPQAPTRALQRAAKRGLVPSGFTPHDLRRTCRTFWAMLRIEETVAKKILGHAPPGADVDAAVYNQHLYLAEMRQALVKWERHLFGIVRTRLHDAQCGVAA